LAALLALLAAPPGTTSLIQEWVQAGADLDGDPSLNPFGSTEVYFGTACAISSDGLTVAVAGGAVGVTPGHVRVFRREGTHYAQVSGNFAVSAPATSLSLSADGTWLATGSPSDNSVKVFRFTVGEVWIQYRHETLRGLNNQFGTSISVQANATTLTLAVGIPNINGGAGEVRIYRAELSTNNFPFQQFGQAIAGLSDSTGISVSLSLSGKTVAVGAPAGAGGVGRAKVYRYCDFYAHRWPQLGAFMVEDANNDYFGGAVSLSDDGLTIAVGAPVNALGGYTGYVRVFGYFGTRFSSSQWTAIGDDIVGENSGDRFSSSLSLSGSGTTLAIGSPKFANNAGYTRTFHLVDGGWAPLGVPIIGEGAADQSTSGAALGIAGDGLTRTW